MTETPSYEEDMVYETIILECRGGIGYLTINRPQVFNAINNQMINEMKKAIEELNRDSNVGVVIITGTGKAFQTGADIEELSRMSPLEILQWNQGVVENFEALEKMKQPV
jgi:enoyl-CoA hydratase/carnithine racemase